MASNSTSQGLSEEKISEYREAFAMFDKDGDGHVTIDELRDVLARMDEHPTDEQLRDMISDVDADNNGTIELEEFIAMMQRHDSDAASAEDDIRLAFKAFDTDGNGEIDRHELKQIMEKIGEPLTDQEIDTMIAEADKNGDGLINFEEFSAMMKRH